VFGFLFKKKPLPLAKSEASEPVKGAVHDTGPDVLFGFKSKTAPSMKDIDTCFMGTLLGVNSLLDNDLNTTQKKSLLEIQALTSRENLSGNMVPRLPSVIPRIMMSIRNEKSTAQDLTDLISSDLTLVGEVIRLSNSACYRTGERVESLKQAIVKLGLNGIRQLVSSAVLKPILNPLQGKLSLVVSRRLWEKNQRAALAGNYLALQTGDDCFQAYLAGLLSQAGILVIIKHIDENFTHAPVPDSITFMHELDTLSKKITLQISRQWDMPTEITQALEEQLNDNAPAELSSMGQVCYIADKLAKTSLLETHRQLIAVEQDFQCQVGNLNTQACTQCYSIINPDLQEDR
jgi:HD-like signal output (HDOD) protein